MTSALKVEFERLEEFVRINGGGIGAGFRTDKVRSDSTFSHDGNGFPVFFIGKGSEFGFAASLD
jgi:hypothetical protein